VVPMGSYTTLNTPHKDIYMVYSHIKESVATHTHCDSLL